MKTNDLIRKNIEVTFDFIRYIIKVGRRRKDEGAEVVETGILTPI